ncbi:MAG: ribosomal protein S18-alanine N-acetyltransferase [Ornithinimicrobium sp.]|uniref:ribosomal protein S18-alanine N-acetyltransferase n=1 Tax=Ornithinimicrobium sp. TaxID=1977084 RepID=UPI003D9BEA65
MSIREMRWQDLGAVSALERELHPDDAWSTASWWAELALRPRRDYLVAQRAGSLVGYAGSDVSADRADVMTLAVAPPARGAGLAHLLLSELHRRAADAGAREMLLEVREDNAGARALYRRHGYRQVHRRAGYYRSEHGPVDALLLSVPLPAAPLERSARA